MARAVPGASAQGCDSAGNGGTVTEVGRLDSGHAAVRHDAVTPFDPCPVVEWLAFNAFVSQAGEQMGC